MCPADEQAVDELKAKHAKLGVLGYCRGGAIAIRVLSEQTPGVTCGMICHPGPIDTKQWETISVPTKWHLAKEDDYMKLEQIAVLAQLGEKKARDGIEMEYKVHEGESTVSVARKFTRAAASGSAEDRDDTRFRFAAERGI